MARQQQQQLKAHLQNLTNATTLPSVRSAPKARIAYGFAEDLYRRLV
jgi:hypothetical protein